MIWNKSNSGWFYTNKQLRSDALPYITKDDVIVPINKNKDVASYLRMREYFKKKGLTY